MQQKSFKIYIDIFFGENKNREPWCRAETRQKNHRNWIFADIVLN